MKNILVLLLTVSSMVCTDAHAGLFRKLVKGAAIAGAGVVAMKVVSARQQSSTTGVVGDSGLPSKSRVDAYVVGVSDGDTVIVETKYGKHTIRLRGIDAPETTCHDITARDLAYCVERYQRYGKEAKAALADMVMGQHVTVVTGIQEQSHGRTVGNIYLGKRDINLEMVKRGLAWHEPKLTPDETMKEKVLYSLAMDNAVRKNIGLWDEDKPTRPADFRKHNQ